MFISFEVNRFRYWLVWCVSQNLDLFLKFSHICCVRSDYFSNQLNRWLKFHCNDKRCSDTRLDKLDDSKFFWFQSTIITMSLTKITVTTTPTTTMAAAVAALTALTAAVTEETIVFKIICDTNSSFFFSFFHYSFKRFIGRLSSWIEIQQAKLSIDCLFIPWSRACIVLFHFILFHLFFRKFFRFHWISFLFRRFVFVFSRFFKNVFI